MWLQLYNWLGRRRTAKYAREVKASLSADEWRELEGIARRALQTDPVFRCLANPGSRDTIAPSRTGEAVGQLRQIVDFECAFTPDLVLSNPLITPYRRPAFRLIPKSHFSSIALVPIIITPRFRFEAFAC